MKTVVVTENDYKPESYVLTFKCPYCGIENNFDTYYTNVDTIEDCAFCKGAIHIVTKQEEEK